MKMDLDRRTFLAGATGALSLSLLPLKLMATAIASKGVPPAPVARVEVVKDTYFGETVSDPYRWMENSKDPDWLPYLKGQNEHTRAIIDALPGRAALLKRIEQLSGEAVATSRVQRASSAPWAPTTSSCSCAKASTARIACWSTPPP
jgi:prolyl oligopeptidase